jgi:hypothetical protein
MTLRQALYWGTKKLQKVRIKSAPMDAEILILQALNTSNKSVLNFHTRKYGSLGRIWLVMTKEIKF